MTEIDNVNESQSNEVSESQASTEQATGSTNEQDETFRMPNDSPQHLRGKTAEEIRDLYHRQSSLRTFVSGQDVADLAVFMASDQGSKISGQAIGLDGHTESLANWLD